MGSLPFLCFSTHDHHGPSRERDVPITRVAKGLFLGFSCAPLKGHPIRGPGSWSARFRADEKGDAPRPVEHLVVVGEAVQFASRRPERDTPYATDAHLPLRFDDPAASSGPYVT